MFHKNLLPAASSPAADNKTPLWTQINTPTPRLTLVSSDYASSDASSHYVSSDYISPGTTRKQGPSALHDILSISAERCGAFLAEAAVLVLVLAILDRFMLKGNLEPRWIAGAIALSVGLLSASIATSFSARRWLRPHP